MTKPNTPLSAVLSDNLKTLRNTFDVSSDLVIREIVVAGFSAAVVSVEGMIDRHMMTDAVLLPLSRMPHTYQTADDAMRDIEKALQISLDI